MKSHNERRKIFSPNSGKVKAAGVDVASTEPIEGDNPLLSAKNCYITPPHRLGPHRNPKRMLDIVQNNLRAYLAGVDVNRVNP